MSEPSQNQLDEALMDLLVKQVTEGLSETERRELGSRGASLINPLRQEYETAAALATLYCLPDQSATPPDSLLERLERQSTEFFDPARSEPSYPVDAVAGSTRVAPPRGTRSGSWGWLVAAACLVAAVFGWLRSPQTPVIPEAQVRTANDERNSLLSRTDTQKATLGATKDPAAAGVSADVVWDPTAQKGYLHLTGLKPNDPTLQQYQAWVFDGTRDQRYPLGAALFNIPSGSVEVVIPLSANVPVRLAKTFAVTLEAAGGTVVPALEHVVLIGPVS